MRAPLPAIPPADKQSVGCPDSSVDSSILEWTENAHNATSVGGRGSNKADTASLKSEKISPGSPVIVIKRDKTTSVEFNRNAAASRRPLKKTLKHTEPQPASKSNIGDDQAPSVSADASERKDLDSNKSNSRDLDSGSAKTEELVARVPTRSKDPVSNICRSKDPVSNTLGSKGPVSTISRSNKARVVSDGEKKGRVRGWVNRMVRNKAPATAEVVVRQGLQRNRSVVSRKQGTPWHQIGNIVLNVMKCLDAKDICVASQVCGLWCDIGTLDEIWKPVYMKQFLLPPPTGISGTRGWKWWYKARVVSPTHAIIRPDLVGQGRVDISTADSIHISVMGENEKGMWEMLRLFYLRWEEKPMRLSDFWWNEVRMAFTLKTTANSRGHKVNLNLMDVTMGMGLEWSYFRQMGLQMADVHLLCFNLTDRDSYTFACNTLAPEIITSNRPFLLVGLHHDFILDRGARTISTDMPGLSVNTDTSTHGHTLSYTPMTGADTQAPLETHALGDGTMNTGTTDAASDGSEGVGTTAHTRSDGGADSTDTHTHKHTSTHTSTHTNAHVNTHTNTHVNTHTGDIQHMAGNDPSGASPHSTSTSTDTHNTRTQTRETTETRGVRESDAEHRAHHRHTRQMSWTLSERELDSYTRLIPYTEGVHMAGEIGAAGYFECSSREGNSVDKLMRVAASVAINDKPKSIIDKCKIS